MLSAKENFVKFLNHEESERYANNYEALALSFMPFMLFGSPLVPKGTPVEKAVPNSWGVYNAFPENTPGGFPVQDDEHLLVKDIECWQDYVKVPSTDFTEEQWAIAKGMYDSTPEDKAVRAVFVAPGVFEQCHHMSRIEEVLIAMYECPDELKSMIDMLVDFELKIAKDICDHWVPEAIFHHDDWGSQKSTFMSAEMFEEFFVDPYKEIYGYYKNHGCELVFHHSDSYGATLVPSMIEMGIDVWQGCMSSNNMPEMVKKYGDKITFMGGFDGAMIDKPDWSAEEIKKCVYEMLDAVGTTNGFIPCIAQGGPGSVFKGVYDELVKAIDDYSVEKMGAKREEIDRLPLQIMF